MPEARAKKRQGRPGEKGEPDVTGCIMGYRLELEGKAPDGKVHPLQHKRIREWAAAGAITCIFTEWDDVRSVIIRHFIKRKGYVPHKYGEHLN